jgi:alanyl-tRNA synthetase
MTERLYYTDSFLYDFEANVVDVVPASAAEARPAVILDRTAFYPTSGGQIFDTGLISVGERQFRVVEVSESDEGIIRHLVDELADLQAGIAVHGSIDANRRRDHMQQHTGQHVLSAAFVRLFNMPTVSFHMGDDYCSIDLETKAISPEQIEAAERMANEIILEDRPVEIRFVSQEEALELELRKLPPAERGQLRLIDIRDFDLSACGGTHVRHTGQIGCILLRKLEKVRQGVRIEFVCGQRGVRTARRDYTALSEAASLFSSHIWEVPQQIRKSQDEAKAARRQREQLLEELAEEHAARMLVETTAVNGRKLVKRVFADRDLAYIKLLAQKLTRLEPNVVALLGTGPQLSVVAAGSPGQPIDLGGLLKQALANHGGRGGGSKDMAQAGVPSDEVVDRVLTEIGEKVRSIPQ